MPAGLAKNESDKFNLSSDTEEPVSSTYACEAEASGSYYSSNLA